MNWRKTIIRYSIRLIGCLNKLDSKQINKKNKDKWNQFFCATISDKARDVFDRESRKIAKNLMTMVCDNNIDQRHQVYDSYVYTKQLQEFHDIYEMFRVKNHYSVNNIQQNKHKIINDNNNDTNNILKNNRKKRKFDEMNDDNSDSINDNKDVSAPKKRKIIGGLLFFCFVFCVFCFLFSVAIFVFCLLYDNCSKNIEKK